MAASGISSSPVNFSPLTPISFLERAAAVHPNAVSIIYGEQQETWRLTLRRCKRLATALRRSGVASGDIVAVVAPNVPEMYEAHFGIPMSGAVLNTINIRLDAPTVAQILGHGAPKALFVYQSFVTLAQEALDRLSDHGRKACSVETVVVIKDRTSASSREDALAHLQGERDPEEPSSFCASTVIEYEEFLLCGDPEASMESFYPRSEDDPIALNYTSGTTSAPKGVVYSHRGAFLNSLSCIIMSELQNRAVYLWTLPMFHCNGWCFPWAVAALSGANVCLVQVDAKEVFRSIAEHRVDILCGAPTVLSMLINADAEAQALLLKHTGKGTHKPVKVLTGGAPPPAAVLGKMERLGFTVLHTYGLTETYGPGTVCEWRGEEWDGLGLDERARVNSRQGVRHLGLERVAVMDPGTMTEVPWDGKTMGEVMFRGNTVMQGYLKDPENTEKAFKGGWFHSGDLGVVHSDGYIQLKDRSKDIIISGGENISTIHVENVLYQHPEVVEAAVVAMPDEKWGETPCAFVTRKGDAAVYTGQFDQDKVLEHDIREFCRRNLPRFMAPSRVVFGPLPKTSTGKVQKFKLREAAKAVADSGWLPIKFKSAMSKL